MEILGHALGKPRYSMPQVCQHRSLATTDHTITDAWRGTDVLEVLSILTGADADLLRSLQASLAKGGEAGEDVRRLADRVQGLLDTDRTSAMLVTRNTVGDA